MVKEGIAAFNTNKVTCVAPDWSKDGSLLRRYAPLKGEATAIVWALKKCKMFIIGCPNVVVVTDHQYLLGVFGDRDLSKIHIPRLFKLRYRIHIQHCPGHQMPCPETLNLQ